MSRAMCPECGKPLGRGNRHAPTCSRRLARSGPSGPSKPFAERPVETRGNRQVRLPEPLATEAKAAVEDDLAVEAAAAIAVVRRKRR